MSPFKIILVILTAITLSACGDGEIIVTRNNVEVPLVPEGIAGNCPTEIEKVVPANGVRYTEEETGAVAERNRIAYVDCRTVVRQIKEFYVDQQKRATSFNNAPTTVSK